MSLPREAMLSRTLRDMLIHLAVFPITLDRMLRYLLSPGFRITSAKGVFLTPAKPSVIAFPSRKPPYSLPFLLDNLALLMVNFYSLGLRGRLSIPAFSERRAMVDCLVMNFCTLLELYIQKFQKEEKPLIPMEKRSPTLILQDS